MAAEDARSLNDLPPEVIGRVLGFLEHWRDLGAANAASRLFRGAPGGHSPVEHALRERARSRGHARALPGEVPAVGDHTWTAELLARECVRELACAHALPVAACSFKLASAFVDADGALLTCGEQETSAATECPASIGQPDAHGASVRVPTRVSSLQAVRMCAVAAGHDHLLALSAAGTVHACGANRHGQLGLGDSEPRRSFAPLRSIAGELLVAVAAGSRHSLALTAAGGAYSWGYNDCGLLGHGDKEERWEPTRIEALDGVRVGGIAGGYAHTLLLEGSGDVYSCGVGHSGQLGHGELREERTPRRIEALAGVRAVHVSAGTRHSLVVDAEGGVHSFGSGSVGCLGHGQVEPPSNQPEPMRIAALARVRAVRASAGGGTSAVVSADGAVHTFGYSRLGVLGQANCGSMHFAPAPVLALAGQRVLGCSLGDYHALYVTADGSVHASGRQSAALGRGLSAAGGRSDRCLKEPARVTGLLVACVAGLPARGASGIGY